MVELEKQAIQFTDDVEILEIYVDEGEKVERGDTLFRYREEIENEARVSVKNGNKPIVWLIRDELNLEKQIALKRIDLEQIKLKIELKNDELQTQKDLVLVGVKTATMAIPRLRDEIKLYQKQLKSLRKEIAILRRQLIILKEKSDLIQSYEIQEQIYQQIPVYYVAKMDGIIGQINIMKNEICYASEGTIEIGKSECPDLTERKKLRKRIERVNTVFSLDAI